MAATTAAVASTAATAVKATTAATMEAAALMTNVSATAVIELRMMAAAGPMVFPTDGESRRRDRSSQPDLPQPYEYGA